LVSESKKKSSTDQVIEQSRMLYGFTPAEKSDKNEDWMLLHGYIKKKKLIKQSRRGRRRKTET